MIKVINNQTSIVLELEIEYYNDVYSGEVVFQKEAQSEWIIQNHRLIAKDFTILNNTDIYKITPNLLSVLKNFLLSAQI